MTWNENSSSDRTERQRRTCAVFGNKQHNCLSSFFSFCLFKLRTCEDKFWLLYVQSFSGQFTCILLRKVFWNSACSASSFALLVCSCWLWQPTVEKTAKLSGFLACLPCTSYVNTKNVCNTHKMAANQCSDVKADSIKTLRIILVVGIHNAALEPGGILAGLNSVQKMTTNW